MTESGDLIQNSQQINPEQITLSSHHIWRRNLSEGGYLKNHLIGNIKTVGNLSSEHLLTKQEM